MRADITEFFRRPWSTASWSTIGSFAPPPAWWGASAVGTAFVLTLREVSWSTEILAILSVLCAVAFAGLTAASWLTEHASTRDHVRSHRVRLLSLSTGLWLLGWHVAAAAILLAGWSTAQRIFGSTPVGLFLSLLAAMALAYVAVGLFCARWTARSALVALMPPLPLQPGWQYSALSTRTDLREKEARDRALRLQPALAVPVLTALDDLGASNAGQLPPLAQRPGLSWSREPIMRVVGLGTPIAAATPLAMIVALVFSFDWNMDELAERLGLPPVTSSGPNPQPQETKEPGGQNNHPQANQGDNSLEHNQTGQGGGSQAPQQVDQGGRPQGQNQSGQAGNTQSPQQANRGGGPQGQSQPGQGGSSQPSQQANQGGNAQSPQQTNQGNAQGQNQSSQHNSTQGQGQSKPGSSSQSPQQANRGAGPQGQSQPGQGGSSQPSQQADQGGNAQSSQQTNQGNAQGQNQSSQHNSAQGQSGQSNNPQSPQQANRGAGPQGQSQPGQGNSPQPSQQADQGGNAQGRSLSGRGSNPQPPQQANQGGSSPSQDRPGQLGDPRGQQGQSAQASSQDQQRAQIRRVQETTDKVDGTETIKVGGKGSQANSEPELTLESAPEAMPPSSEASSAIVIQQTQDLLAKRGSGFSEPALTLSLSPDRKQAQASRAFEPRQNLPPWVERLLVPQNR